MTNNQKLRQLMDELGLTYADIAKILGVSLYTVKSWRIHDGSEAYRTMPDNQLKLLTLLLQQEGVK